MKPVTLKIIVSCGMALGIAVVVIVGHFDKTPAPTSPLSTSAPEVIHTSDWYLSHRDVLAVDEKRCAGDTDSISPVACQNVNNAVSQLNYNNAESMLNQAATSNK